MNRHRITLRLGITLSLVAGVAVGVATADAAGCAARHPNGRWTTIDRPPGASVIDNNFLTVDPSSPGRYFAAQAGTGADAGAWKLMRTTDAGCTWKQVLALQATDGQVHQVIAPNTHANPAKQYVYVLLSGGSNPTTGAALPDKLAVSTDGGTTWNLRTPSVMDAANKVAPACTQGAVGNQRQLYVAPSAPATVYLWCRSDSFVGTAWGSAGYRYTGSRALDNSSRWFVTRNAGATWSVGASQDDTEAGGSAAILAAGVDPIDPQQLWVVQRTEGVGISHFQYSATISRSLDGGKHFSVVQSIVMPTDGNMETSAWAPYPAGLIISRTAGRPASLTLWMTLYYTENQVVHHRGWLLISRDGGRGWRSWTTRELFAGPSPAPAQGSPHDDVGLFGVVPGGSPTTLLILGADYATVAGCGSDRVPSVWHFMSFDVVKSRSRRLESPVLTPKRPLIDGDRVQTSGGDRRDLVMDAMGKNDCGGAHPTASRMILAYRGSP